MKIKKLFVLPALVLAIVLCVSNAAYAKGNCTCNETTIKHKCCCEKCNCSNCECDKNCCDKCCNKVKIIFWHKHCNCNCDCGCSKKIAG